VITPSHVYLKSVEPAERVGHFFFVFSFHVSYQQCILSCGTKASGH
jgi:hypothetical protein